MMRIQTPEALVTHWRERAEVLREEGCTDIAAVRERCAVELEDVLHRLQSEKLTIERAAVESGYNPDYLRRFVRENPTLNAGRVGKPLILRKDLPKKAATVVHPRNQSYDVTADARSLVTR